MSTDDKTGNVWCDCPFKGSPWSAICDDNLCRSAPTKRRARSVSILDDTLMADHKDILEKILMQTTKRTQKLINLYHGE